MPTFKVPEYTKITDPKTGLQQPCYTFHIDYQNTEEEISFVAESSSDITLHNLQKCILENVDWWNKFILEFLQASSKFFTKHYTVEHINKLTKHSLINTTNFTTAQSVYVLPLKIQIIGGSFIVIWGYTLKPFIMIDIPDLEGDNHTIEMANLPVRNVTDNLEELNIDEIPVENNSTEESLKLDSPLKFYDKQRVKEARLKAKLAVYKAQRQMTQYYEKYGDISDSDSDSESESSDEGDEFNQEEVQL